MVTCLFYKDYFFNKFQIVSNISQMEMYTQRIEAQIKTIETTDNNTVPQTVVVVMKLSLKKQA